MKHTFTSLMTITLLLATSTAFAAGGGGGGSSGGGNGGAGGGGGWSSQSQDPAIQAAKNAIAKKDWLGAQNILKVALASSPNYADYHNLYAYSVRKGPNPDMAVVFQHYTEALRINPSHLDALEYMGEAYLTVNEPGKAKENLKVLDGLCFFGCAQYTELKTAIAAYETSHP